MPRKKPGQFRFKVTVERTVTLLSNVYVYAFTPEKASRVALRNLKHDSFKEVSGKNRVMCVEKKVRHITGILDARGTATVTYPRK